MTAETTTLYYKQGSSDKIYTVNLVPNTQGLGCNVTFSYGKRGGPQQLRVKSEGIPAEVAKALYASMIHAKKLKGYTAGEDAAAYTDNPNAGRQTNFMPQLANDATLKDIIRIFHKNPEDFCMQVKHDGERRGVIIPESGTIRTTNRKGQEVPLKTEILDELMILQEFVGGAIILDTEDMGNHLVIFDCCGGLLDELTFDQRATQTNVIRRIIVQKQLKTLRVDTAFWPESEAQIIGFVDECEEFEEEGVIVRLNTPYTPGRPNSMGNLLKLKFIAEATCQVLSRVENKASVHIGVLCNDGDDTMPIGKVTIPPNYDMPNPGDLVEIKYMNIMRGEGAKLFQPRFKGVRTDKDQPDRYSSLKFKKEVY